MGYTSEFPSALHSHSGVQKRIENRVRIPDGTAAVCADAAVR